MNVKFYTTCACGKHPDDCMCRTTVPADLEEIKAERKARVRAEVKLGDELRALATERHTANLQSIATTIYEQIAHDARKLAEEGKFNLGFYCKKQINGEQAFVITEMLKANGFTASLSQVDGPHNSSEDLISVSWK